MFEPCCAASPPVTVHPDPAVGTALASQSTPASRPHPPVEEARVEVEKMLVPVADPAPVWVLLGPTSGVLPELSVQTSTLIATPVEAVPLDPAVTVIAAPVPTAFQIAMPASASGGGLITPRRLSATRV
jgi:hypothetical protein